jgi:hypothetical protein
MLSARDYVEIMTTNRLNRKKDEDVFVSDEDFNKLCSKLEGIIYKMSHQSSIPGFDENDIAGFCQMKIHQIMRRGKPTDFSYCARALQNTVRDILKQRETAIKQLHQDMIEDCEFMHFYNL